MNKSKTLVLFDFDGTLTKKDSLLHFLKFAVGNIRFYIGMLRLAPILLQLKMKWISPQTAKENLLYYFLKDFSSAQLNLITAQYTIQKLPLILKKTAMEKLHWHQAQDHEIYLVSASAELWLEKWCKQEDIGLIATELSFENDRFAGKFLSPNCNGQEKVNRIKKEIQLSKFNYIFAYGDTEGDQPMLALADEAYFQHFKD